MAWWQPSWAARWCKWCWPLRSRFHRGPGAAWFERGPIASSAWGGYEAERIKCVLQGAVAKVTAVVDRPRHVAGQALKGVQLAAARQDADAVHMLLTAATELQHTSAKVLVVAPANAPAGRSSCSSSGGALPCCTFSSSSFTTPSWLAIA